MRNNPSPTPTPPTKWLKIVFFRSKNLILTVIMLQAERMNDHLPALAMKGPLLTKVGLQQNRDLFNATFLPIVDNFSVPLLQMNIDKTLIFIYISF